jgi:hypothetical protein
MTDKPVNDHPDEKKPPTPPKAATPAAKSADERTVVLVDANRQNPTETAIPIGQVGHHIHVNGQAYEHVGVNEEGVWVFAPA